MLTASQPNQPGGQTDRQADRCTSTDTHTHIYKHTGIDTCGQTHVQHYTTLYFKLHCTTLRYTTLRRIGLEELLVELWDLRVHVFAGLTSGLCLASVLRIHGFGMCAAGFRLLFFGRGLSVRDWHGVPRHRQLPSTKL